MSCAPWQERRLTGFSIAVSTKVFRTALSKSDLNFRSPCIYCVSNAPKYMRAPNGRRGTVRSPKRSLTRSFPTYCGSIAAETSLT